MEAEIALHEGDVPVGAIIVMDGRIIAKGHNTREKDLDISGHAEINAIKEAARKLGHNDLSGCAIYVTLEPCLMCGAALQAARISSIVYGAEDPTEGAISRFHIYDDNTKAHHPLVRGGILSDKCSSLLKGFFQERRK